jgi:hypothetical protein
VGAQNPQGGFSEPTKWLNVGSQNPQSGERVTAPRPHHQSATTVDTLPCDVAVEVTGGLVDVYLDTNHPVWQRIRFDTTTALKLYRRLGELISSLPIRMKDTDQ